MKIDREHMLTPFVALQAKARQPVLLLARTQASQLELHAALAPLESVSIEPLASLGSLPGILDSNPGALVILVECDPGTSQDLDLIRDLRRMGGSENVAIVALTDRSSATASLQAIRAGADDVLLKPVDLAEAREVFARVAERGRSAPEKPAAVGKTIVFMHFSGGAGATTLAVNSAAALARSGTGGDACLVDLDVQFGNAANLLDLSSASPVQDFVDDPTRLDEQMLGSMMLRHATGLHVLTAPHELVPLTIYGEGSVAAIIGLARRRYEFVVVDLPAALASWTDSVLHMANVIYVVTPLTVPAAHRLGKFLQLLRSEGITGLPLKIVANRYIRNGKNSGDITIAQFEKAVGLRIDYLVPNDYSLISTSHGQGKPAIKLKPNSPFTDALKSMLASEFGKDLFSPIRRGFFSRGA
jgi:pilus assembly protein CpaE